MSDYNVLFLEDNWLFTDTCTLTKEKEFFASIESICDLFAV